LIIIALILRVIFYIKYYIEYKVKESENVMLTEAKTAHGDVSQAGLDRMSTIDGRPLHSQDKEDSNDPNVTKSPIGSMSLTSDEDAVPPPEPSANVAESASYNIKFEGVGLTLPSGVTIMKGVCGEFKPKRMCAIMGPSGAG
jgi:ABC-type multidrug transport system fused ATPase/permease subunit